MFNLLTLRDQIKAGLHPSLIKIASRLIQFLTSFQSKIKNIQYQRISVLNQSDIVANHFEYWSSMDHQNRKSFSIHDK